MTQTPEVLQVSSGAPEREDSLMDAAGKEALSARNNPFQGVHVSKEW